MGSAGGSRNRQRKEGRRVKHQEGATPHVLRKTTGPDDAVADVDVLSGIRSAPKPDVAPIAVAKEKRPRVLPRTRAGAW